MGCSVTCVATLPSFQRAADSTRTASATQRPPPAGHETVSTEVASSCALEATRKNSLPPIAVRFTTAVGAAPAGDKLTVIA